MVQSMTGYGRSEALLSSGKLTLEIRTLNGKGCDISVKGYFLPKDKELWVRQRMAETLVRGTIDLFLSFEPKAGAAARTIDAALVENYFRQMEAIGARMGIEAAQETYLQTILRFSDIYEGGRQEAVSEAEWPLVAQALEQCLEAVVNYRRTEGDILRKDVCSRVATILALEDEVESHEGERLEAVRSRLMKNAEELRIKLDPERFEQEMVFYLEKLDINEEKVRLRQHCRYFLDTLENEPYPGKKLGFIIQEMGREINTTGSKANHAAIQACVVRMKDELEKVREQSMNIL